MKLLESLSPSLVWKYFAEILEVPRPSKKEEKIIEYLENFAKSHNLNCKKDSIGNIVIKRNASAGFENRPVVVLQSHVDMVCEKNSDKVHDFLKDPITPKIEGDWIKADGTTLGADNGIGIAAQLAVLSDPGLKCGAVECLFTVDEETGLTGAFQLEKNMFSGKILLNLDSEDEGEIFIGCAGGIDTLINFPFTPIETGKNLLALSVRVYGLTGGHSGDDIHKGFANSNKILARFLWNCIQRFRIQIADFQGGNLRNAIPREAATTIVINQKYISGFEAYFKTFLLDIKKELVVTEPGLNMEHKSITQPKVCLSTFDSDKLINALHSCPNGVISMSQSIEGLVETSTNLASVHFIENNVVDIVTSQRSSVESARYDIASRIKAQFSLIGAKATHTDGYPGWAPNTDSEILEISKSVYNKLFNVPPKVKAIHAGLECGLFLEKYPDLDMISFGPTLKGVHSPDERMQISTVEKFWKLLTGILENV